MKITQIFHLLLISPEFKYKQTLYLFYTVNNNVTLSCTRRMIITLSLSSESESGVPLNSETGTTMSAPDGWGELVVSGIPVSDVFASKCGVSVVVCKSTG